MLNLYFSEVSFGNYSILSLLIFFAFLLQFFFQKEALRREENKKIKQV